MRQEDRAELYEVGDEVYVSNPDDNGYEDCFGVGAKAKITHKYEDHYQCECLEGVKKGFSWWYADYELSLSTPKLEEKNIQPTLVSLLDVKNAINAAIDPFYDHAETDFSIDEIASAIWNQIDKAVPAA